MQWRNRFSFSAPYLIILSGVFFSFSVSAGEPSLPVVRTPAKELGKRFTVKVQLKQGNSLYVVPFWVDPKRKTSAIDERLMKEVGWKGIIKDWDVVSISRFVLPVTKFKNADTEEAFLPDYVKSCCYGILGQDILKNFEIEAHEGYPAHIEWYQGDETRLQWLTVAAKYKWETLPKPLFKFVLRPPERRAFITQKWEGIPANARWLRVQGKEPAYLDTYLLEDYLKGKIEQKIELEFEVGKEIKTVLYEFKVKNPLKD